MKIIDDGQAVISIAEYDRLRASDENRDKIEVTFRGEARGMMAWLPGFSSGNEVKYLGKDEAMQVLKDAYDKSMTLKDEDLREVKIKASDRWHELDKIQSSFWYRLKVLFAGPKL